MLKIQSDAKVQAGNARHVVLHVTRDIEGHRHGSRIAGWSAAARKEAHAPASRHDLDSVSATGPRIHRRPGVTEVFSQGAMVSSIRGRGWPCGAPIFQTRRCSRRRGARRRRRATRRRRAARCGRDAGKCCERRCGVINLVGKRSCVSDYPPAGSDAPCPLRPRKFGTRRSGVPTWPQVLRAMQEDPAAFLTSHLA